MGVKLLYISLYIDRKKSKKIISHTRKIYLLFLCTVHVTHEIQLNNCAMMQLR